MLLIVQSTIDKSYLYLTGLLAYVIDSSKCYWQKILNT